MIKEHIQKYLPEVLVEANSRFKIFKSVVDYGSLSTKLKSELISNMLEASFSKVVPNVVSPFSDGEPDLWVKGNALEIKTAKTTHTWRGGEFSKRESDYLLVSYDDSGDDLKWFFLHTYLMESDWKSSGSDSYYATTIDLNDVLDTKEYSILIGDIVKKRIKKHLICC
jgi:hypothetical protein